MAKIKTLPRLIAEDFDEENQDLISKIAFVTNPAFEQIVQAFNKNLTIDDNLNMQTKDLEITVNSKGEPTTTTSFKSSLKGPTKGLIVIKVDSLEKTTVYPISTPFITFTESGGQVTINHVTGLVPNSKYQIRVFSIG